MFVRSFLPIEECAEGITQRQREESFIISLLLLVSFLTLGALMLMHRPQKVDAFLNSDEPVESKHVVTSGMIR
jgi:hypothetical protein